MRDALDPASAAAAELCSLRSGPYSRALSLTTLGNGAMVIPVFEGQPVLSSDVLMPGTSSAMSARSCCAMRIPKSALGQVTAELPADAVRRILCDLEKQRVELSETMAAREWEARVPFRAWADAAWLADKGEVPRRLTVELAPAADAKEEDDWTLSEVAKALRAPAAADGIDIAYAPAPRGSGAGAWWGAETARMVDLSPAGLLSNLAADARQDAPAAWTQVRAALDARLRLLNPMLGYDIAPIQRAFVGDALRGLAANSTAFTRSKTLLTSAASVARDAPIEEGDSDVPRLALAFLASAAASSGSSPPLGTRLRRAKGASKGRVHLGSSSRMVRPNLTAPPDLSSGTPRVQAFLGHVVAGLLGQSDTIRAEPIRVFATDDGTYRLWGFTPRAEYSDYLWVFSNGWLWTNPG